VAPPLGGLISEAAMLGSVNNNPAQTKYERTAMEFSPRGRVEGKIVQT
jgi:hypothetical protein